MQTTIISLHTAHVQDRHIRCCECGQKFIFSANEQAYFNAKKLVNSPRRCPNCRVSKRLQRKGAPVVTVDVECAGCGAIARIAFQPFKGTPIYCAPCFHAVRNCAETYAAPIV